MANPLEWWRDNTKAVWNAGAELAPMTHLGRALGLDKLQFGNTQGVTIHQGPADDDWEGQVQNLMNNNVYGIWGDRDKAEDRVTKQWGILGKGAAAESAQGAARRSRFDQRVSGSNFMDVLAANEPSMFKPKQATGQSIYSAPKV